jgi:hypothetical protein
VSESAAVDAFAEFSGTWEARCRAIEQAALKHLYLVITSLDPADVAGHAGAGGKPP